MAGSLQTVFGLVEAGKLDQAAAMLTQLLQRRPGDGPANNAMAVVAAKQGRYEQAEFFARRAIQGSPKDAVFHETLGHILASADRRPEAIPMLRRAIALAPGQVMFHLGLATMLWDEGLHRESMAEGEAAMGIAGGAPAVAAIYASLLQNLGRCDEAAALCRSRLERFPQDPALLQALVLTLNYMTGQDPQEVLSAHVRCAAALERGILPVPRPPRQGGRKLRVGYLSPDLRRHSVTYFAEPVLEGHDRSVFDVYVYFSAGQPDAVTKRLQSLPLTWRDCGTLTDEAIAQKVAADGIDILVELSGHTSGNRLGVMARRPAPVQATYIGYPNTVGMSAVGYRIVDAFTDPSGAERWHSEKLVRLPGCFLCYRPDDEAPEVRARGAGPITFGSFNNCAKITEATMRLWARVLDAAPGSRLVVKATHFRDAWVRGLYQERFAAAGLNADRVTVMAPMIEKAGHLAAYAGVDIALDPFPYNGTTTTCEALWMGVPVVTLAGQVHAGRVGVSLLTRAGLPELIASSEDEYVAIASGLAKDAARLASLRGSLRERMRGTLCEAGPVVRGLEAAYLEMCRGVLR